MFQRLHVCRHRGIKRETAEAPDVAVTARRPRSSSLRCSAATVTVAEAGCTMCQHLLDTGQATLHPKFFDRESLRGRNRNSGRNEYITIDSFDAGRSRYDAPLEDRLQRNSRREYSCLGKKEGKTRDLVSGVNDTMGSVDDIRVDTTPPACLAHPPSMPKLCPRT